MVYIISREDWSAAEASRESRLQTPVNQVFSSFTQTDTCLTIRDCRKLVKELQQRDINNQYGDIGYNFLVGGDGSIYEGRGWTVSPQLGKEHEKFKDKSLHIAFCGNRIPDKPIPKPMYHARYRLIKYGVVLKFINPEHKIVNVQ